MQITEELQIHFEYRFSSGLHAQEHARYVKEITLSIELCNEHDERLKTIGQIDFLQVLIDNTWEAPYPLYDILDIHSEYLARHIFNIYDTETRDFSPALQEHYKGEIHGGNIGLIQKITLLPSYRGYQIGAKALKDLMFHYNSACALFALQPFLLQFEALLEREKAPNLQLEQLEQDPKKAFARLSQYYQSLGFEPVEGIEHLLFVNPALKNEKLDRLDLDAPAFGSIVHP